jgi:phosphoribosylformylglycinamidine cyclo-ligase
MAHITGGGLVENVPRVLADNLTARIDRGAWTMPPLFSWLQRAGNVADDEMLRVFNCGIGMTVIVSADNADAAIAQLSAAGETVSRIGTIRARKEGEHQTIVV